jgi:murein DD-endopeptidase MepM/ murein hydrolase activator NlpD
MRQSGKWDDGTEEGGGLGAETFFETLDVELATYLSRVKGLGLSEELEKAIAKTAGGGVASPAAAATAAAPPAVIPTPASQTEKVEVAKPISGEALRFAVAPGSITSSYGWRHDPFTGQAKFHRGIDVRAAYGQDIQSAGAGCVVFSGQQRGYGNTVLVEHADGVQTRYAHLSATVVQEGEMVAAGQVLGRAGKSGRATGTHLHFEVIKNGRPIAPETVGFSTPAGGSPTD